MDMRIKIYHPIEIVLLVCSVIIVMLLPDNYNLLPIVGWFIILLTVYLLIKTRRNAMSFFLMCILGLVNVSIGISDLINKGIGVSSWQLTNLRMTDYDMITAKTVLLFLAVFNLFINGDACNKRCDYKSVLQLRKYNPIISFGGIILLYLILILGIIKEVLTRTSGDYISVSSTLYEYGVILVCITWYYSRGKNKIDILIKMFVLCYSIAFVIIGDRSSVFMYILMLYLLYYQNKFKKIFILGAAIMAIFVSNVVDAARTASVLGVNEIIEKAISKGLYVDTVSWAYYGGIVIVALSFLASNRLWLTGGFLLHLIGINISGFTSFTSYAAEHFPLLYNRGGGLCSPYLYFMGGYIGVAVGAVVMGAAIKKFFTVRKQHYIVYAYIIIAMSLRWYIYNPTAFFRTILINCTIFLILCRMLNHEKFFPATGLLKK